ncbi:MAG TPA: OmpH family outer membrane protein [Gemmatimonadaceae bacterium]|nr:OmpH family outer membrane protein [Gemmatimonadaceae bacterium]HEX6053322.1 OmpH family outer membrane protein [Gemmatimonadaceae bacterium]
MAGMARASAVALALMICGAVAAQAQVKIGYIKSQTILANAPGREAAESQFEKEMATYRAQVQRMGDSLNALIADYNKQEVSLSPQAKEARQKDIRTKEEEYQRRTQELQTQVRQREAELVRPIMEQINKVIDELRADEGYTMIFDAENQAGVVVAADKNLDLTDKVLARLRAAGPPTAAARPTGAQRPPAPGAQQPSGVQRPKPR